MMYHVTLLRLGADETKSLGLLNAKSVEKTLVKDGATVTAYTTLRTMERVPLEVEVRGEKFVVVYGSWYGTVEHLKGETMMNIHDYAVRIQKTSGVGWDTALRLAQCDCTSEFLETLAEDGYEIHEKVESICYADGGEIGEYIVFRDGHEIGRIPFSCCGIEIPKWEDFRG